MPYETISDLPDTIKNSLPTAAQKVWLEAYNGAEKQGQDEETRAKVAWTAVKNGWEQVDDKWIKKQAEKTPSKKHDFDAEIFSVGTWNGDKYTVADLDDIVDNFSKLKGIVKPPVKLGHNEEQMADGNPALGWAAGLKRVGEKLIASLKDVPDIVYRAIKQGLYKRVSSEIFWNYKHEGNIFKRVLAGVALLGADIPAVTNLEDLEAYLTQSTSNKGSFEKVAVYSFNLDKDSKITDNDKKRSKNVMSEEDKRQLTELKAKVDAAESKQKEAEVEAEEAKKTAKEYKDKMDAADKKASKELKKTRTKEFKLFCEDMVKDGKMLPAQRDVIVAELDKEESHLYIEATGFGLSFDTFKAYAELIKKVLDEKEYGLMDKRNKDKDFTDASKELDAAAKKYMKENKETDLATAMAAVLDEDDDLAKRYEKHSKIATDEGGD